MFALLAAKMYRVTFWMKHWGSPTWKRTSVVSNARCVGQFDRGQIKRSTSCKFQTATKYKNKQGKVCYTGTRLLRSTGFLACIFSANPQRFVWPRPRKAYTLPRQYPMGFAKKLISLLPRLQAREVQFAAVPWLKISWLKLSGSRFRAQEFML